MKQRREAIVGVAGEMEHAAFAFERDPHAALPVSVIGVVESQWDFGSSVMEARILRPLLWFGLLESRTQPRAATELVDPRL
jgi:hypothetical protein